MQNARQDRPINRESADALDRGPFVGSLIRALVHDEKDADGNLISRHSTGYVVGLTGRWGLGKSSVLSLLSLKLSSMDRVVVVNFNPWLFKGRDELVTAYFNSLREAMGRSKIEQAREVVAALDKYWAAVDWTGRAVAAYVDLHGGMGYVGRGWKWLSEFGRSTAQKPTERSPEAEREELEKKIAKLDAAVVILIDELDRVEDEEVRAVAQLIKAIGDIKGISYLVAYDPGRVADALGRGGTPEERRRTGESYLEKIIQYPIPLRPLFLADVESLLAAAIGFHNVVLLEPAGENQRRIMEALKASIVTPREVKRLIGAFAILEEAVRGEICPYDVLAYSWIATKAPSLRDRLETSIEQVVDDPGDTERLARMLASTGNAQVDPDPVTLIGPEAAAHLDILKLLFPRFDPGADGRRAETEPGNRIYRRRNLVRLLFLGNPPGMVSRVELERLWAIGQRAPLETELRKFPEGETLSALIDRLDDFLPDLPPSGDRVFWTALASLTERKTDWIQRPESMRDLADDIVAVLLHLGTRDSTQIDRAKDVVAILIDAGDLVLVPLILRKHMFLHGLTKHRGPENGRLIFSKDETAALLDTEVPRYRSAILGGTALRRLPNVEAIYVISNCRRWDDKLRAGLTAQLIGPQALSTLAALLVPPGYSTGRAPLDELFDATVVSERIAKLAPADWPVDPSLSGSLRHLSAILRGDDPDYPHNEFAGTDVVVDDYKGTEHVPAQPQLTSGSHEETSSVTD